MVVTDPIADLLTRIRNAVKAKHKRVEGISTQLRQSINELIYLHLI